MKRRIIFLLQFFGLTVLLFLLAKIVFMVVNHGAHPFEFGDVVDVLRYGLTLDFSTALYFLVVPFMLSVVSIWYVGRLLKWVYCFWAVITAIAFSLAFAADTALYPHWGFKLDATCLQFLSTPGDAMASVTVGWMVVGLIGLIGLIGLMGFLYWKVWRPLKPLMRKWPFGLVCIFLTPLIFIGIRGGLDESTTNIGQVYFSQKPFLNHSAVNPVFSFLSSFESSVRTDTRYSYFTTEECDSILVGLFNTETVDADTLLSVERPHVVLVMLEGAGGQFMKIAGRDSIMPYLNRLCSEGVYFSNCYANSYRTDRGTVCTWSGYPSFPTMSVMKDPSKSGTLPSIARSLRNVGYDTQYFYGGDINFTKMRSYLVATGFEHLKWKADYPLAEQKTARWGVCDELMFGYVRQEIENWVDDDEQPHLLGFSTLSSHEPWDVPIKQMPDPIENSFRYLDQCIEKFIEPLRQSKVWKNLLIVMVPDHGIGYYGLDETTPMKNHIPVLWVGGAVADAREIDVVCNQTDQAATLLGQLGIDHSDFRFSRDVLSKTYTQPFAYHTFNNGFSLIDSTRFVSYDLTGDCLMVGNAQDLVKRGKALLQVTSEDLSKR